MNLPMQRNFTQLVLALVCVLLGCEPEIDPVELHFGSLNINKYVSIGDSYTAGASDGGIYRASQENSFPALLTQQIREVQQIPFNQPYLGRSGTGYLSLERVQQYPCIEGSFLPTFIREDSDLSIDQNIVNSAPFHNLGIPKLALTEVTRNNLGSYNDFFRRLTLPDIPVSYLELVEQVQADLFTLWLGIESVFEFAHNGHLEDSLNEEIFQSFGAHLDTLITAIYRINPQATVLVADIPDVVSFPFFDSIDFLFWDSLTCVSQPIYIEFTRPNGTTGIREANSMDRILLPAQSNIGLISEAGLAIGLTENTPLPDSLVLDQSEVQQVRALIAGYNRQIENVVSFHAENTEFPHKVVKLNLAQQMNNAMAGQTIDGSDVSATYLTGGLFSLDGYTLSPRGNALISNFAIQKINENFQAQIPPLNITDYEGVVFP